MPQDDSFDGLNGLRTLLTEDGEPEIDLASSRADLFSPGEVIDRYIVEDIIGRGGVATVYRVRHTKLETAHALKLLNSPGGRLTERLLAEGRLLAPWRHPNIVRVQDAFEAKGGLALLMELVEGPTLAQWLASHPTGIPPRDAELLFRQLLAAVKYAHQQEVIHRDLKTSNILLEERDGELLARVTDFGIAKILGEQLHSMLTDTRTGALLGTPAYMAPEQIDGASSVDARADIFALGVILYEMCAGSRPFEGASVWALLEALRQVSHIPIQERAPRTPEHLVRAIEACLIRDPANRVPDVETLEAILDGQPWQPPSPRPEDTRQQTGGENTNVRQRPSRALIAAGVLALATITILAAAAAVQHEKFSAVTRENHEHRQENQRLREARERADMERLAWKMARENPAAALALLRALRTLEDTPPSEEQSYLFDLLSEGALTKTIPTNDQVVHVSYAPETRLIAGLLGAGDIAVWELDTGKKLFQKNAHIGTAWRSISFSHNGTRVVVSHAGGESPEDMSKPARIFDARTGEVVNTFAHGRRTFGFSYSSDGRLGATSDFNSGIQIWDMQTGGPLKRLEFPLTVAENGLTFSDDGRLFAAMERAKEQIYVFDTNDWSIRYTLSLPRGRGRSLVFSPDSKTLVAYRGGSTRAWSMETGEMVGEYRGPDGFLLEVTDDRVLSGSKQRGVSLLELPSLEPIARLDAHESRTMSIANITSHQLSLTTSSDHTAALWSTRSGGRIGRLRGHMNWVLDGGLFPDKGVPFALTGGRDHTLKLWSLVGMGEHFNPFQSADPIKRTWSDDGRTAAIVDHSGDVQIWREGEGTERFSLGGNMPNIQTLALIPGEDLLMVSSFPGPCHIYDFDGALVATLDDPWGRKDIECRSISAKDKDTLLVSYSHNVHVVDRQTWEIEKPTHPADTHHSIGSLRWNTKANKGIYRQEHRSIVFIDDTLGIIKEHRDDEYSVAQILELAHSPGAIVTHWYPKVERWNLETQEREWLIDSFEDGLTRAALTEDDAWLAVGSPNGKIHLIDMQAGEIVHTLIGHEKDIWDLRFSPDETLLASSSKDGTVRIWSVTSGKLLDQFPAHSTTTQLRFSTPTTLMGWTRSSGMFAWDLRESLDQKRDWFTWSGERNNYRICRKSLEVIPVIPFPDPSTVWAPEEACGGHDKQSEEKIIE